MKKIAAIFLASVFLFNWFGFRLVSFYLEARSERNLEVRLDKNQYNDKELVAIKIPAHLPYFTSTSSRTFERMNGDIEINGVHYNYVKRRIYNDSIEYLCIANPAKTKIERAANEFYKLVNDIQRASQSRKPVNSMAFQNPLSEFFEQPEQWRSQPVAPSELNPYRQYSSELVFQATSPQERPPDA